MNKDIKYIEAPPNPSSKKSLSEVGYTFETAISDIVDNSIDAKAKKVKILIQKTHNDKIWVQIIDDGIGMNEEQLIEAMTYGKKKNTEKKSLSLGKFSKHIE